MHKRGSFKDQIKNAKTSRWWIQWLTWACTCQREIEVLPSYPGLNCKVTDRGPMFEMAKFVGGPGSSVLGEREKCVLVYKTLHFLFYLVLNINWIVKMFGCVMAPPFGKMRLCIQRNKYKINDHSYLWKFISLLQEFIFSFLQPVAVVASWKTHWLLLWVMTHWLFQDAGHMWHLPIHIYECYTASIASSSKYTLKQFSHS